MSNTDTQSAGAVGRTSVRHAHQGKAIRWIGLKSDPEGVADPRWLRPGYSFNLGRDVPKIFLITVFRPHALIIVPPKTLIKGRSSQRRALRIKMLRRDTARLSRRWTKR